jgi:hypothetical protein
MKKAFLFLVCVVFSLENYADIIGLEQARQRAVAFFADGRANSPSRVRNHNKEKELYLEFVEPSSAYYAFNVGEDEGFVLVSGDDMTAPILGYADSGSFHAEALAPAMKTMLDNFARRVQQRRANDIGIS